MLKQTQLSSLKSEDKIEHFLLLTKFSEKKTKSNKSYLDLELRDQSAALNAKMWSNFESILPSLKEGNIIKVLGSVEEYNNQAQIRIDKLRVTTESDLVSIDDFLPKSFRNSDEMIREFTDRVENINNLNLKKLLKLIFTETNFNKYKRAPAGKAWHHAYIGGLLEHTLEIIKICDLMCNIHFDVNRDLLITGAILHDFAKIEELTYDSNFDYTDKGKLIGHIVLISNIIEKTANEIQDFPEELKIQLIHLVISHQGKLEYASPVTPKTLEAIILYQADELSAKTNAYKLAILSEKGSGNNWTKYLPLAETSLYIKDTPENKNDFKETLF